MASDSKKKTSDNGRSVKRWATALAFAVVAITISAYLLLRPRDYSNDPRVVEIREIQEAVSYKQLRAHETHRIIA